ncbi:MAG: GntR family transcriptional regulator [Gemmatimonadaceae bacterium]
MPTETGQVVPRNSLVTEAFDRVRDLIVTGRLAPGATIIETEVAAVLGVRRSHLRQALQRLHHAGFVTTATIGTYSRTRVAPLTAADAQDLFEIVGAVEGLAARAAALLPATRRTALARELASMNTAIQAAAAARPADYNRVNDLDVAFHRHYVEGVASSRVCRLHDSVKPQADRYERHYTNALLDDIAISVAEHEAIVAAIAAGDPDAAQRAVETNWRNAGERFSRVISVAGERGRM